jgi:hypothetical protein
MWLHKKQIDDQIEKNKILNDGSIIKCERMNNVYVYNVVAISFKFLLVIWYVLLRGSDSFFEKKYASFLNAFF